MDKSQGYWEKQTSSRHRFGDDEYFQSKAREHASLMVDEHKSTGCIDLGCGAGELLKYLSEEVKVDLGLDYSDSMLDMAQKRLAGKNINLVKADLFDFLPDQKQKVWITCGAINQYLDIERQREFLNLFAKHHSAEALYLFDCVDPIRYSLLNSGIGIGYIDKDNPSVRGSNAIKTLLRPPRRTRSIIPMLKTRWKSIKTLLKLPQRRRLRFITGVCQKIGGPGMGYGFLPKFWIDECNKRDLRLQIVSSRFYEYRYHVIINKKQNQLGSNLHISINNV
ncbi:MAG TPA: class I SAM-dependent methyltransferase [Candidatus Brocadiaceae bacterium]|nr:class I SAM-dependent methyltransferase [Candidatus Brocadiaceae bacterium]